MTQYKNLFQPLDLRHRTLDNRVVFAPGKAAVSADGKSVLRRVASALNGDYAGRGSKTYKAGEAFMEAVGTWHNGRNSGEGSLRILAIFIILGQ